MEGKAGSGVETGAQRSRFSSLDRSARGAVARHRVVRIIRIISKAVIEEQVCESSHGIARWGSTRRLMHFFR